MVLPAHLAPVWGRRPGQCHQSAGGLARPLGLHTVRQWGQRGWVFIGAPVNRANICRWREGGAVLGDLVCNGDTKWGVHIRSPGDDERFPVLETHEPTLQIRADN